MVPKRRFNCGFDFNNIPKGPRSSRRKVSSKRADDYDNQFCAIDLLASLAAKLLEESESSSTSSIEEKKHQHEDGYNENTSETYDCNVEQTKLYDYKKAHGLMLLAGCDVNGLEDPSQLHVKFQDSVHINGIVKLSPGTYRINNGAIEEYENHSKLVCRDDDDENYRKFYKVNDRSKSYRPLTRAGNRRIKKYGCLKDLYSKRESCYGYNHCKNETIHRKMMFSDKGLVVNSDGGLSSESVSNSPDKEGLVKLSIKSLRIPELIIEVPQTATVGSLKRTVMEAVTALLGDGLSIGVLVQGKKVKDDNNMTLSQIGLLCKENVDNIGFTLEPGPETLCVSMQTDSTNLSERSEASPLLESCPLQDSDHLIHSETSHELVPYQSDISADEQQPSSDSRALVPVSALEPEALAIVPVSDKLTETSQRRIRRPFSVIEVEALVHAVEELGTGRWRDVKLRCFKNATHRTYVDLKDKWKTLVHTATIAPRQRRGEPLPQELLDRVYRYWSQHQMKQKVKLT